MRKLLKVVSLLGLLGATLPALGQEVSDTATFQVDRKQVSEYCVWKTQIYSPGASFCTERSAQVNCVAAVRVPADVAKNMPESITPAHWEFSRTADCDPNAGTTPN